MKKSILINVIILFLFSFPIHFLYALFPSFFTSIFAPVNESIFEHVKMIFTSLLLGRIIIYFIRKKKGLNTNNYIIKSYLTTILTTGIFLFIYLPIYYLFGENLIITLIIYFITILITEYIVNNLFNKSLKVNYNLLGITFIILTFFAFTYLSYNPLHIDFFYDPMHKKYGI